MYSKQILQLQSNAKSEEVTDLCPFFMLIQSYTFYYMLHSAKYFVGKSMQHDDSYNTVISIYPSLISTWFQN